MICRSWAPISVVKFPPTYGTLIPPVLECESQIVHSGLVRDCEAPEPVRAAHTEIVWEPTHPIYPSRFLNRKLCALYLRFFGGDLFLMYHLFVSGQTEKHLDLCRTMLPREDSRDSFKPRPRTFLRAGFFIHRAAFKWDALPKVDITSVRKSVFRKQLDTYLGWMEKGPAEHRPNHHITIVLPLLLRESFLPSFFIGRNGTRPISRLKFPPFPAFVVSPQCSSIRIQRKAHIPSTQELTSLELA